MGKQCFVGARSVVSIDTVMEDEGKLDDMSMLPIHGHIPKGAFFSGAPACQTIAPEDHITNQKIFVDTSSPMKNCFFGLMHYLCLIFSMMVYYVCYFPALLLITHYHEKTHYLFTVFILAPLGAVLFLGLHYFATALCKRVLMNKIKPGIYPLKSFYYLRQWTIVQMLDIEEVFVMADTLYFPSFLRFLGANLGPRVELGEIPHVLPDLVTIDDEGFIASAVALAWPTVYQGAIAFAPIQVGKRGFVGNMSLLPLGSHVGDGGLLGCMTIAPPNNQAADQNTSWLGSPAIFLPKREQVTGFSDAEKFKPTKRLFYLRLVIEFIRIIMPTSFKMIALFNMLYVLNILSIHHTHHYLPHYMNHYITHHLTLSIFIVFPFVDLLIISTLVFGLIALKWITLGRLKPASKPIWSVFIWKNDVITYIYSYFITPHLTNFILGTPFVSILSRFFGAKIGKKVFIDTADFTEFDLITIDDEVCINAEAVIQTHLYEDRIFKMSTIHIKDGANIGVASVVLYDTVMEKNSTLGNFSLLMKGETLPENTSWQGIPAQPMSTHYYKSQGLTT